MVYSKLMCRYDEVVVCRFPARRRMRVSWSILGASANPERRINSNFSYVPRPVTEVCENYVTITFFIILTNLDVETLAARTFVSKAFDYIYIYIYIYSLGPKISGVEQTQTSNKLKLRTNSNFEQTQTSNKPKLRTNPNLEQTQTSNEPKLRTNPNFEQIQTSNQPNSFWPEVLVGIIRPWGILQ